MTWKNKLLRGIIPGSKVVYDKSGNFGQNSPYYLIISTEGQKVTSIKRCTDGHIFTVDLPATNFKRILR